MLIYWTNTNGGNFDTAADWDTDQVPPSNHVPGASDIAAMLMHSSSLYTVDDDDGTATTVAGFTTGADTIFQISNGSSFTAIDGTGTGTNAGEVVVEDKSVLDVGETLDNTGDISLNSTGHFTTLAFLETTSMTGGGQIDLSNSSDNIIQIGSGLTTTTVFVTNVNNTIQGVGKIIFETAGTTFFTNDKNGVIEADGGALTVANDDQGEFLNFGSLTATNGGTLFFNGGGLLDESGAEIGSDDGTVEFQGTSVFGGTFFTNTALDQGTVEFLSTNNELLSGEGSGFDFPVTNNGALTLADGSSVDMAGMIDNNGADGGTIDLDSSGGATDLIVGAAAGTGQLTLTGSGKVDLSDSDQNLLTAETGTKTPAELVNVNNDISGSGTIEVAVDNEKSGIVDATGSANPLTVEANVENAGLLEGTGSQGLVLGVSVTNAATGVISAGNGSSVTLDDVTGGTLTGAGVIDVVDNAILKSLTNTGSITPQGADVVFSLVGTIHNNGSITLAQQADEIEVEQGGLTLTGNGAVQMTGEDDGIFGSFTLDNDGNDISGEGVIGDGAIPVFGTTPLTGLTVHNVAGIISANDGGTLSIDTGSSTIVNDATLAANPGCDLFLGSPVSNSGVLDADDGSITAADAVTDGSATITDFGEIEFGAASNTTVKFASGSEGTLILDDAVQYTGLIEGFNASEAIDLTDIAPTAKLSFGAGVLTINGGPGDVAHLHFSGPFTLSEFSLAADGGNGSILTDPPAAPHVASASNVVLLGSYMAAAFATAPIILADAATLEGLQQPHLALPHA